MCIGKINTVLLIPHSLEWYFAGSVSTSAHVDAVRYRLLVSNFNEAVPLKNTTTSANLMSSSLLLPGYQEVTTILMATQ